MPNARSRSNTASSFTETDPLVWSAQPTVYSAVVNQPPLKEDVRSDGPLEMSSSMRLRILAGMWAAMFLSSLNTTLVATLLPSICSDFQKSQQASWLGTAYLLATCTFNPLYGRLCDVLGRRTATQIAILFAVAGTILCGTSQNMETLIFARFLAGIGGGGILTISTIVTSDLYSLRSRGLAQGIVAVFDGLGFGLGGPIGGYISDNFGWRWAFLIQLPLFILSFTLITVNLCYVTPGEGKSVKEMLKRIDYGGSLSLLLSVLFFLIFLSTKFNENMPWDSSVVYVPLAISAMSMILFVIIELYVVSEPILAPFLLKSKIAVLVATSSFLVAGCNFTITYNLPTWFQTVMLTSASEAGAHLIPNGATMSLGSLLAGWIMHRTGRYKTINLTFGILPFIGAVLIASMRETSHPLQLWLSILPLGFGNAVVLATVQIALLANIPSSAMAVGTGFNQLFRGVGQVAGVAVSSAVFQSTLNSELHKRIQGANAEQIITEIRHSATLVATLPAQLQRAAKDSYAISLRAVFIMAAVSTFLAYVTRLPIPDKKLDEETSCGSEEADSDASTVAGDEGLSPCHSRDGTAYAGSPERTLSGAKSPF